MKRQKTKNLKKHTVKDCPYHANKDKILIRINEIKSNHKLFSMESETALNCDGQKALPAGHS